MSASGDLQYLYLRPRCGLCNGLFVAEKDTFVTLVGDRSSTKCEKIITKPAIFPDYGFNYRTYHGYCPRRTPPRFRSPTDSSPEAVVLHPDCLKLFRRECTLKERQLDHLWISAAWRHLHRHSPNYHLPDETPSEDMFLEAVLGSNVLGRHLPLELIMVICHYLAKGDPSASPFGRYVAVMNLARELSQTLPQSQNKSSYSLAEVRSWKRGGQLQLCDAEEGSHLPVVHLAIDSHGIQELRRFSQKPVVAAKTRRFDHSVFMLLHETAIQDMGMVLPKLQFKYGQLRFQFERMDWPCPLQTWDTPTPPGIGPGDYYAIQQYLVERAHFRSIDLDRVSGLTFFAGRYGISAIHAHTAEQPCARATAQLLSRNQRNDVAWVYLPLPPQEQITLIGCRVAEEPDVEGLWYKRWPKQKLAFLVRLRVAGDVVIGPQLTRPSRDYIMSSSPPGRFYYNAAELCRSSTFAATAATAASSAATAWTASTPGGAGGSLSFPPPRTAQTTPLLPAPLLRNAILSSAPLDDVVRICVFEDNEYRLCRGLLLEYGDGAQRTVGQCRVGEDVALTCEAPTMLCFLRTSYRRSKTAALRRAVRVNCLPSSACGPGHKHKVAVGENKLTGSDKTGWVCVPMAGVLEFWCTALESAVQVVGTGKKC